jgi:4-alpha-glucanotransferase
MKSVTFCFATHNHQPIGNFDYVFEEAFHKSYLPFFKLASEYEFRFATHFSGILLDWLVKTHPEHIESLTSLVKTGQVEIISGGFYEPILSIIPEADRTAQIEELSTQIKTLFGHEPQGLWLAERVWEQQLASSLARNNIKYVILDDTHFRYAGLENADLTGYYLTEDLGQSIAVFPISKELRYTIPFASVDETIRILRDAATEKGENLITFADDGEKFGVWPKTFEHVYGEGWLEEFFAKLDENASWLRTMHFSDALNVHRPKGNIYLPNASYAEMMQWALPTAKANLDYEHFSHEVEEEVKWSNYLHFVRGGFWRNFFVKYPASNHFHKRMLGISGRFEALAPLDRGSRQANEAYDHLLAAQCNDASWHGVFGGIYLANLRHEAWKHLLTAERELDKLEDLNEITIEEHDENADGTKELIVSSKQFALRIDPARGGCISEISFKPAAFNLTNFIDRTKEASHEKLKDASKSEGKAAKSIHDIVKTKEKGLEKRLVYDWYRHGCLIEHFLDSEVTADQLSKMSFLEYGDFFQSHMSPTVEATPTEVHITFDHIGNVHYSNETRAVRLVKKIAITNGDGAIRVDYHLTNLSEQHLEANFASEWTFGLLAGNAHDRYYESQNADIVTNTLNSIGTISDAQHLALVDEWGGFRIDINTALNCTFLRAPIETIASSEAGFERVYQGSIVLPVWNFALVSQETKSLSLAVRVASL